VTPLVNKKRLHHRCEFSNLSDVWLGKHHSAQVYQKATLHLSGFSASVFGGSHEFIHAIGSFL
jgi:hypothetical protein